MTRTLIIYATPTGPLADACGAYFDAVLSMPDLGETTAQTYPPHITLTGFFRRDEPRATGVVAEMKEAFERIGSPPYGSVSVTDLVCERGWVGLTIESAWLIDVTTELVASHRVGDGEDALRPKSWLHLSLAYDVDDAAPYFDLARSLVDPDAEVGWELGVWERLSSGEIERISRA